MPWLHSGGSELGALALGKLGPQPPLSLDRPLSKG
jgi:hypothetical protein